MFRHVIRDSVEEESKGTKCRAGHLLGAARQEEGALRPEEQGT